VTDIELPAAPPAVQETSASKGAADQESAPLVFDIKNTEIPSFKSLQDFRQEVFVNPRTYDSFAREVEKLGESGEEGRRRGLGCWMIADYEGACRYLGNHGSDDVASFTHANALMSLQRAAQAAPIFKRLSEKYPGESKPLGGYIGARFEAALAQAGDEVPTTALEQLEQDMAAAPAGFAESAEGHYLLGRAAELRRELQAAIDHYERARELDPSLRANLFRLGYLAERAGLDELALDCYESLAKMRPIERSVLMNLGLLYEDLGQDQEAATCYDTVYRHDPTDARARLYLGHAQAGMTMYYDEDLERKEDRLNQILRIPITDFELSVRARNCLNKMNIMSLGDLVRKTEQELLSYKNFGETSLNEIKEILGSKGLRLGMAREEAVLSIETAQQRYTSGENVEAMNRPISELELSIRARRTVEALGCLTLGDVVQHSEDELLGMPNFGVTSLMELREKLAQFDLSLKSSS
jgi:DNA-directed RNA polymerase subunit alpha